MSFARALLTVHVGVVFVGWQSILCTSSVTRWAGAPPPSPLPPLHQHQAWRGRSWERRQRSRVWGLGCRVRDVGLSSALTA